jgi:hypothetical protein
MLVHKIVHLLLPLQISNEALQITIIVVFPVSYLTLPVAIFNNVMERDHNIRVKRQIHIFVTTCIYDKQS